MPGKRGQVELQRVAGDDLCVRVSSERLGQDWQEGAVELHGRDALRPLGELGGEAADAGADFEDGEALRPALAAGLGYAPGDGGLYEEVLAQAPGKADAVPVHKLFDVARAGQTHLALLAAPIAVAQALCSGMRKSLP